MLTKRFGEGVIQHLDQDFSGGIQLKGLQAVTTVS